MTKLLIITGPTATGKTKLGVLLARKYNGEIISADSRQVYKYMDIATGKDKSEYGEIPVWGLDLVEPSYNFNVSDFVKFANEKINDVQQRGKLPIIVGGTALYIKALAEPPETLHIPKDEVLRLELEKLSIEELQKRLGENMMNASDVNNPRRLVRAIEVKESGITDTGRYSSAIDNYTIINLTAPLDYIFSRIDQRVEDRLKHGAKAELEKLVGMGFSLTLPSMSATGYHEIEDPELWKLHERQYAKRQIVFLKKFIASQKANGTSVIEWDIRNEPQENSFSI